MRKAMKRKVMQNLLGNGIGDTFAGILATTEHELLTTAQAMEEAHGVENIEGIPTVEERKAALKKLMEALISDSVDDVWIEEIAPALLDVDDPERVRSYLGMDREEWEAQMGRWADAYRDQGANGADRDLAAHHVRQTFGVDLDTFEKRIVEWDRGQEAERLFAGNFRAVRQSMQLVKAEGEE